MKRYIKANQSKSIPLTKEQIANLFSKVLGRTIELKNIKKYTYTDKGKKFTGYDYSTDIILSQHDKKIYDEQLKSELLKYTDDPNIEAGQGLYSNFLYFYIQMEIPIGGWKGLRNQLEQESNDGIDSLYEQTEAGEKLESVQQEVENALGIWLEPSVQAGVGGIWFYSSEDDHTVASNYDYQTFNEDTIVMAIRSKNKTEFKKRYKAYLENILTEYAVDEEDA